MILGLHQLCGVSPCDCLGGASMFTIHVDGSVNGGFSLCCLPVVFTVSFFGGEV